MNSASEKLYSLHSGSLCAHNYLFPWIITEIVHALAVALLHTEFLLPELLFPFVLLRANNCVFSVYMKCQVV